MEHLIHHVSLCYHQTGNALSLQNSSKISPKLVQNSEILHEQDITMDQMKSLNLLFS